MIHWKSYWNCIYYIFSFFFFFWVEIIGAFANLSKTNFNTRSIHKSAIHRCEYMPSLEKWFFIFFSKAYLTAFKNYTNFPDKCLIEPVSLTIKLCWKFETHAYHSSIHFRILITWRIFHVILIQFTHLYQPVDTNCFIDTTTIIIMKHFSTIIWKSK